MGEVKSTNTAHTVRNNHKIYIYSTFFAILFAISLGLRGVEWKSTHTLHTLFELTAALLACFIGILSILRFYTKRSNMFFLIGLGFLGAAVLDGYHSISTPEIFGSLFPLPPPSLIPWSWNTSRIFLSLMLFLSWWSVIQEEQKGELGKINVKRLALLACLIIILSVLLLAFVPLSDVYYEKLIFRRPHELISGLFFLAALVGYFQRGLWKSGYFDYWMIFSLIASFALQILYMSFSRTLFDPFFDAAHVLKIASYVFVLIGLLTSMYHLFKDAEESRRKLAVQNMELLKVQREVEIKTMQLSGHVKDMERQNKQMEETQKIAFKLVKDVGNAKAEMEREQAKDEALFVSIGEGIIATDREGKIIKMNIAAPELLGLGSRSSLIGKSASAVILLQDEAGKFISAAKHPVARALSHGKKIVSKEYYFVRKDTSRFPAAAMFTPIVLDKVMIGTIIVFRDITLEKEVDRAKTEFVSLASHQLRTPLSAITWYAEMLLDEEVGAVSPKQRQYLDALYACAQRMVELVQSFLNVSRIELGTFAIEPQLTDLREVAKNVLGELKKQIHDKSLSIEKQFAAELPHVNVDPNLMTIVFQNLLSNAVKYTGAGGKIILGIACDKTNIVITVSDTGCGIPDNQQEKIFTKLFRADNVRERVTDGNGLGLYIVKAIVDKARGKIWFTSEENKGTTFYVNIPLAGMKPKKGTRALSV